MDILEACQTSDMFYGNLYNIFYIHEYLCLKEVMKSNSWNYKNVEDLGFKFYCYESLRIYDFHIKYMFYEKTYV